MPQDTSIARPRVATEMFTALQGPQSSIRSCCRRDVGLVEGRVGSVDLLFSLGVPVAQCEPNVPESIVSTLAGSIGTPSAVWQRMSVASRKQPTMTALPWGKMGS